MRRSQPRFAVDASSEVDYHLPIPGTRQRREIFRLETERVLGNDWVVRHHNRLYQVERQSRPHAPAQSKVMVCQWEDGTVEIQYRGQKLPWHEIEERAGKPEEAASKRRKPSTPPAAYMPHHPWRRSYQDMHPRPAPAAAGGGSQGLSLRSALNARPSGLAGLRSGRGPGNQLAKKERGHF